MADDPEPTRFRHTPITLTVDEVREALTAVMQSMCDCENPDEANTYWPHANVVIDALIAAVRAETLAEYTLTDSDVDKFLEACEKPIDPERVERIRKLFNDKLKR